MPLITLGVSVIPSCLPQNLLDPEQSRCQGIQLGIQSREFGLRMAAKKALSVVIPEMACPASPAMANAKPAASICLSTPKSPINLIGYAVHAGRFLDIFELSRWMTQLLRPRLEAEHPSLLSAADAGVLLSPPPRC